jgi:hypothetical protein
VVDPEELLAAVTKKSRAEQSRAEQSSRHNVLALDDKQQLWEVRRAGTKREGHARETSAHNKQSSQQLR